MGKRKTLCRGFSGDRWFLQEHIVLTADGTLRLYLDRISKLSGKIDRVEVISKEQPRMDYVRS